MEEKKSVLMGKIYEFMQTKDFPTYAINSLTDNVFIDDKGEDFNLDDIVYFIVYKDVFKELYEKIYQHGFMDGKKAMLKDKYRVNNA